MSTHSPQAIRRFGRRGRSGRWEGLKQVPTDPAVRRRIRDAAERAAAAFDGDGAPTLDRLEIAARDVLTDLAIGEDCLGFTMVLVANAYWADRLASVPYRRRLLLLPRCLGGPAPAGPNLDSIRRRARQLGYRTLIADGVPVVVNTLATESIGAVVGVACLDSLEAVFEKIWQLQAPAVAVPLLTDNCTDTSADLAWLAEYLESRNDAVPATGRYVRLLQLAGSVFAPGRLGELLAGVEPAAHENVLDATGSIARDWLATGGKRLRPFITLAATAALTDVDPDDLPDAALKVAVAIEAFHKASLAHDDIEDDDDQRYGRPTLHRTHGPAMAINVGDYLLGLGYRLIAAAGGDLPPGAGAALLGHMSRAHMHLTRGQGAELTWRRNGVLAPPSSQMLKVYALKTAPAFAAALASGVILGGGETEPPGRLEALARHIGVGFQLLNDLTDWADDIHAGRPTYLTAAAAEAVGLKGRAELLTQIADARCGPPAAQRVGRRFDELGTFAKANELLDKLRDRAGELSRRLDPPEVGRLCEVLVGLVLT